MFSTPLICCSIGVTTVAATTSALAPGYWPDTLMMGGAISGYCAIGRRKNDTPPMITNTIETTAAKIGRSMKKCEMRIASLWCPDSEVRQTLQHPLMRTSDSEGHQQIYDSSAALNPKFATSLAASSCELRVRGTGSVRLGGGTAGGRRHRLLLWCHLDAGTHAHEPIDDDVVLLLEPVLDDAQAADGRAERDVALARDVLAVDHQRVLAGLLGRDGGVRHEQRLVRRGARHLEAGR